MAEATTGLEFDSAIGSANLVGVNRVRAIRLEKRKVAPSAFTLAEVARRTGVSVSTLVSWESGDALPHKRNQRALARALGVSVANLGFTD